MRALRSFRTCEKRIQKHLTPTFGEIRAAELGTQHIKTFKKRRQTYGAANAIINRELELLQRAFRLGYEAEPQLVLRPLRIEVLPEGTCAPERFRPTTIAGSATPYPPTISYCLLSGITPARGSANCCPFAGAQVDLARSEIRLEAKSTKTKKARILPIYGEMKPAIELSLEAQRKQIPQCPFLFQTNGEQMTFNWRAWIGCCKEAGVSDLRFHDLRRTALTNTVNAGIPEKRAMEVSGHKTRRTFERYHIVDTRTVHEVAEKMEKYLSMGTISGTDQAQNVIITIPISKCIS